MSKTKKATGRTAKKLILRYGLIVLIALILGFVIYQWNASTLANDRLPMPLGFGMAVVVSGSMEPELSINDLVIVCPQDSYEVGDVVVFQTDSSLVIHRIIEKLDDNTVITQGDANNTPDAPISIDTIKGKMAFCIPVLGVLVSFFKSTFGTVLILVGAVWLYIRSLQNEIAEDQKKLDQIREEIDRLKKG